MKKINNGTFDFFTFATTFTVLLPEQSFSNSRKASFKNTAMLVHKRCASFNRGFLKWELIWGKRDSPKWRQFCPTVSSGDSGIIKADQKWTRTDKQSDVPSPSFKTHTA